MSYPLRSNIVDFSTKIYTSTIIMLVESDSHYDMLVMSTNVILVTRIHLNIVHKFSNILVNIVPALFF